ncbi:MAG: c-type cytochrome domain-containing protein [Saprospiraceae bacterium]
MQQQFFKCKCLFFLITVCFLAACSSDLPTEVAEAYKRLPEKIDFNYHVRPILSDRCYACHGPDEKARKAHLRLDNETDAFAALKEGAGYAFLPHQPFKSEAVKRILSSDPELVMPTPASKMTLNAMEKATIVKWLEQGAE